MDRTPKLSAKFLVNRASDSVHCTIATFGGEWPEREACLTIDRVSDLDHGQTSCGAASHPAVAQQADPQRGARRFLQGTSPGCQKCRPVYLAAQELRLVMLAEVGV